MTMYPASLSRFPCATESSTPGLTACLLSCLLPFPLPQCDLQSTLTILARPAAPRAPCPLMTFCVFPPASRSAMTCVHPECWCGANRPPFSVMRFWSWRFETGPVWPLIAITHPARKSFVCLSARPHALSSSSSSRFPLLLPTQPHLSSPPGADVPSPSPEPRLY